MYRPGSTLAGVVDAIVISRYPLALCAPFTHGTGITVNAPEDDIEVPDAAHGSMLVAFCWYCGVFAPVLLNQILIFIPAGFAAAAPVFHRFMVKLNPLLLQGSFDDEVCKSHPAITPGLKTKTAATAIITAKKRLPAKLIVAAIFFI